MADAPATTTVLSDVLKRLYKPRVREQLNNEILVLQILSLNTEDIEGLEAVMALHTKRSKGVGARRELADLPEAGSQKYKQVKYDLAYLYGKIMVSGPAIVKTKSDAGSWIRAMREELDRIRDDLALDFARQTYGNGDGVLATVASTVITGDPEVVTLTSGEALEKGFIHPGMSVDFGSIGTPTAKATNVEVIDCDPVAMTFTVANGTIPTVAAADKVFRFGSNDASGTAEMTAGLQKLVSTAPASQTDVGGLSSVDNAFWRNHAENAADAPDSGAISLSLLMQVYNRIVGRGAKPGSLKLLSTPGISRRLFESADFKAKVQFVNTKEFGAGFTSLSFAAGAGVIELVSDRLAPYGNVYFLDGKHIEFFSPADWDFLARDGAAVKWVDNKDAFQSILFRYVNMGCDRRNTNAVIYGLTDTGI